MKHRIYITAKMNYGIGSDNPEELAYFSEIRKEMENMKKLIKKGITIHGATPEKIYK